MLIYFQLQIKGNMLSIVDVHRVDSASEHSGRRALCSEDNGVQADDRHVHT